MALSNLKEKSKAAKAAADDNNAAQPGPATPDYSFLRVHFDQGGHFKSCQILQTGFVALLQRLGFRRFDKADKSFIVVRVTDNIIEEYTPANLRVAAVRYFDDIDEDDLFETTRCPKPEMMEKLYRSLASLLSDEKLSLLVDLRAGNTFNLCADTLTSAYYFYQNGFVEVSKEDGVKLRPYTELPGLVWRDQILQRSFTALDAEDYEQAYFYKFMQNVAFTKGESDNHNAERLASLRTIAGYNLHRFFNTHLRATVLLDARTSDEPDGRSGKSLFCKALRLIMNSDPENGAQCRIIDGKTFLSDNRFKFEELAHNTRLAIFDDILKGTSIEQFFNAIPDGLSIERKGMQSKERVHAKLIFTLNYTLTIRGGSAKDRVFEFEFADYYSSKFKPEHEFKHWFFRDWDAAEWNRFDNVMMSCVDLYMRLGLVSCNTVNLEERKLRQETAPEFVAFMEDLSITHGAKYDKKELFQKFADLDDDGKARYQDFKWLKQRHFSLWLTLYAEYRPELAGYLTFRSNGRDFIRFFYNEPIDADYRPGAVLFPGKSDNCIPSDTNTNTNTNTQDGPAAPDLPF